MQGIRYTVLFGATGTCIGACIKVFSVGQNRFYISLIGQALSALCQTFVLPIPARLAAVWFGPDQVSTACSIGLYGNQVRIF